MHGLTEDQLLLSFLAIAILLFAARATAEMARRLGQPEVLGELLGGFLIGPSVLGALFPAAYRSLYGNPEVASGLSLLSWIGAILLLLIAGLEADLQILRLKAVPGLLAAAGAIGSSLAIGTLVGWKVLGRQPSNAFFLGLVFSVTAVSVVAKMLIERQALRRDYAQVMLAAGIASEVVVWPIISVISSVQHQGNPVIAGIKAAVLAAACFAFMLTLGRRFTFWAMRRVADLTSIATGELSLILLLMCVAAAISAAIGLHALLGAFLFGVLLGKAPRATVVLKERLQALTVAFFAPIFFGLAGMRVNLFQLRGWSSIKGVLILLVAVGLLKIVFGTLGAAAGRVRWWEATSIGVGLNLKGGSDVVVAIVGTEMGLLSPDLYTMYAVVAILTVMLSPPLMAWLTSKAPPGKQEMERLNREEARRCAYLADMEHVLVPMMPELVPSLAATVVRHIALAKHQERELFDITELSASTDVSLLRFETAHELVQASGALAHAAENEQVELHQRSATEDAFSSIAKASQEEQLIAMGAHRVTGEVAMSFGALQDRILRETRADVLVTVAEGSDLPRLKRILVPVNGLEHSLAAADVAAYIAKGAGAEVVLFNVMQSRLDAIFWRERESRDLLQAGYRILREAKVRIGRLDVRQSEQVRLGTDPGAAVLEELQRRPYELVVLGAVARTSVAGVSLGGAVHHVLREARVPRVLLISRGTESGV